MRKDLQFEGRRLLVVTQHYYPENFRINDLVSGLIDDGIVVDVLCGIPNYPTGEWIEGYSYLCDKKEQINGVTIYRALEIRRRGNSSLRIFLNYISWPFFASIRALSFKRQSYDAIFCYNTSPVLMIIPAYIASRITGAPLFTYVLDIWPDNLYTVLNINNSFLRFVASKVSNLLYSKSQQLIAPSKGIASLLSNRLRQTSPLIPISYIPQHAESFYCEDTIDEELQSRFAEKSILLFTGSLTPAQDLETVLLAMKELSADNPSLHLLLVGDGMSRQSLEQMASRLGIEEHVTFFGQVPAEHIPKFTSIAAALIISYSNNPLLECSLPAKLASCMAAGKPIIALMNGEGSKIILEAQCGFTCRPGSPKDFVHAAINLFSQPKDLSLKMGENARQYYLSHFSKRHIIEKLETVLFSNGIDS